MRATLRRVKIVLAPVCLLPSARDPTRTPPRRSLSATMSHGKGKGKAGGDRKDASGSAHWSGYIQVRD